MELKNLRIFIVVQGVLVFLLVITAFFSATNLNRSLSVTIDLIDLQEVVRETNTIESALEEERIAIGQYPLTGNEQLLTRIEDAQAEYNDSWTVIVKYHGKDQAQLIDEIEKARGNYVNQLKSMVEIYQANPEDNNASELLPTIINYYLQNLEPKYSDLSEIAAKQLAAKVEIEKTRATTLYIISNVALVLSIVVGIAVVIQVGAAVIFSRRMINAINEIVKATDSISRGDMDVPINTDQVGEIGDLAKAIDRMRTSLRAAIERLRRY
ncbi:MAG: HAMP domain-containing protein [Anaerolineales bacterium]